MQTKKLSFICFLLFFGASAFSENRVALSHYTLKAQFNEARGKFKAEALLWITALQNNVENVVFTFPPNVEFNRAYDSNDDRMSRERLPSVRGKDFQDISIELTKPLKPNDSAFIRLTFDGNLDTNSFSPIFLNENEFVLQQNKYYSWLPFLSPVSNSSLEQTAQIEIELTLLTDFTVVCNTFPDTITTDEKRIWKFSYPVGTTFETAFSMCGSRNFVHNTMVNQDSTFSSIFYFSPQKVNERFADSLQKTIMDAQRYFSAIAPQKKKFLRYTFAGNSYNGEELFRAGELIVFGNSPAYFLFDSLAFQQSTHNEWLYELARNFCPNVMDSTTWFEEGFAGYLASRYVLDKFAQNSERQRHERFDVMSKALDFFPSPPIALGSCSNEHEKNILSFKGRYVFLMLEYLLGRKSFDTAIKKMFLYAQDSLLTISTFRQICEIEYGSSLDWFFEQWLYRSAIPEFVLESETQKTPRGLFATKSVVTQRGENFAMPLNLVFTFAGRTQTKRVFVEREQQEFLHTFTMTPSSVELDPNLFVLRWLVELRIFAHAQTSMMFRVYNRDLENSEKEAEITLQLDPNNNTGTNSLAYFSLGKAAMLRNNIEKAQEYFLKSMEQHAAEEIQLYPLLSLLRYANTLEMQDKRNEALLLYQRALNEAKKNPLLYAPVIVEAEKFLRQKFISNNEVWYGKY